MTCTKLQLYSLSRKSSLHCKLANYTWSGFQRKTKLYLCSWFICGGGGGGGVCVLNVLSRNESKASAWERGFGLVVVGEGDGFWMPSQPWQLLGGGGGGRIGNCLTVKVWVCCQTKRLWYSYCCWWWLNLEAWSDELEGSFSWAHRAGLVEQFLYLHCLMQVSVWDTKGGGGVGMDLSHSQ